MIELRFPESSIPLDPLECPAHRGGIDRGAPDAPTPFHRRAAGPLEHVDVLRDGRQRHVEASGELADRSVAEGEAGEDLAPRRVGERGEGRVQHERMVNHVV